MRRYGMTALVALVLAGSIAGCGGSGGSETAEVQQDYTNFLHGLASGNGSQACSGFSPALQQRIVTAAEDLKIRSCAQLFQEAAKQESAPDKRKLESVSVKVLAVKDGLATVRFKVGSTTRTQNQVVEKYQGHWRIAGTLPTS